MRFNGLVVSVLGQRRPAAWQWVSSGGIVMQIAFGMILAMHCLFLVSA